MYSKVGNVWSHQSMFKPSNGSLYDLFGNGIACNGQIILVGAPRHDAAGPEFGNFLYILC